MHIYCTLFILKICKFEQYTYTTAYRVLVAIKRITGYLILNSNKLIICLLPLITFTVVLNLWRQRHYQLTILRYHVN